MTIAEIEAKISQAQPKHRLANTAVSFCVIKMRYDEVSNKWGMRIQASDCDKQESLYFDSTPKRAELFGQMHLEMLATGQPFHRLRLERRKLEGGKTYYKLVDAPAGQPCACESRKEQVG